MLTIYGNGGALRPYVNDQLNSRSTRALPPADNWKIHWQQEIENGFMPAFVLQAADRILLQGPSGLKLLNLADGKAIITDGLGAGNPVLDADSGMFFHPEISSMIAARRLSDGARVFVTGSYAGNQFSRLYLARRGRRLLVVSIEYRGDPHGAHLPNFSAVQVQDLGEPPQPDENQMLVEAKTLAEFTRETGNLVTAVNNETIVIAAPNRILITDFGLYKQKEFKAEFVPLAMSLDEAGRIYPHRSIKRSHRLLVGLAGRSALPLSCCRADLQIGPAPPIVGYNHRAYIIGSNRVLGIDPNGKLAWVQALKSPRATAVVTFFFFSQIKVCVWAWRALVLGRYWSSLLAGSSDGGPFLPRAAKSSVESRGDQ